MTTLQELRIDPDKLRAARGSRKAASVARLLGISRSSLNHYEKGRQNPPGDILARLLTFYGVNIADVTNERPKKFHEKI